MSTEKLEAMLSYLDDAGRNGNTASVELVLGNGQIMTIKAGGSGIHSGPVFPPFENYEVILDRTPPRFWSKYTDKAGMVYAHIPRLLLTHHITRRGGVSQMSQECHLSHPMVIMNLQIEVPAEYEKIVMLLMREIKDAHLISSKALLR